MKLQIDNELRDLMPPLSDEEFHQLSDNLEQDGCREPLVVWNWTIIDGHNRYRICTEKGISFRTVDMQFADKAEAIDWILRNQLGRRNLNDFQRSEIAFRYQEMIAKKMKEHSLNNLKKGSVPPSRSNDPLGKKTTQRKELAKIAGTSEGTLNRAKVIMEHGSTEQKERARKGGSGNGVFTIYKEVMGDRAAEQEPPEKAEPPVPDTKVCKRCGEELHVSNFYEGRNICKQCAAMSAPTKNWKGEKIEILPELKKITKEEVIGNLYNVDEVVEHTVEDAIEAFTVNFESFLYGMDVVLEMYQEEIRQENKKMMAVLSEAVTTMNNWKEKYLYERE